MKKSNFLIYIIVLSVLFSCKTTENYDRLTSDDCLIAIPTGIKTPKGTKLARTYYIEVSDLDSKIPIPHNSSDYIYIKIKKDNHSIISLNSKVTNDDYTGKSSNYDMNIQLPYLPGEVIIADFKVFQKIERAESGGYLSNAYMSTISDKEKERVLVDIKKKPELSSWFK